MPPVADKNASFMRSLCMGYIEEDLILPFPKLKKSERETLQSVLDAVKQVLKPHEAKDFRKWDVDGEFPKEFIEELKQFGLFGLVIPEEHGGMGFGSTAYSRTLQEVAKYDASVAVTVGAHSSIGMRGLLLFGTDEQKKKYMPRLATGELIAAFCLTEPEAGSDAAGIKTRAVLEGDHWLLNGQKLWVTNGGIADYFTVFAKTGPEGSKGNITAFIVERAFPGVSNEKHEDKMGIRASSTTVVHFDNVKVPKENVLGELGKGFKVAMSILNSGRTGLGGGATGTMKHLIELATKQAKERKQFGQPISDFALIKQKIGHMVVDTYAAESVVAMVANLTDQGYKDYAVEAAISKVFASEALWRTADEALQVAAGNGFMREYPYERIVRDSRIMRIFEGTNDILRLFIALTAMNDVGTQLKDIASTMQTVLTDPIKGFGVLSDYALKHAALRTGIKRPGSAFTRLSPVLKNEQRAFEEDAGHLAAAADRILRKYGSKIVGKQFPTKRLADIMIDMFTLACVLSRVNTAIEEKGERKSEKELEILRVFCGQVSRRVKANFAKIDNNDDDLIRSLADDAFEREGFGWDTI